MSSRSTVPALVVALAGAGCLPVWTSASSVEPQTGSTLAAPVRKGDCPLYRLSPVLLGAKEGTDIGEMEAPAPAVGEKGRKKEAPGEVREGGFVLKAGAGVAFPGTGAIGSAHGSAPAIPAYSDVWTSAGAFDITGEFGAGKKLRPYAQASFSQFEGVMWTNPDNDTDSWMLSGSSLTLLAGGVRFGDRFYGKAGAGLLLWPEVNRVEQASGFSEPVLASGATAALALGGGAEFALGRLKAYVDAEFLLAMAPERAENAVVFWPKFEPAGMNSFKLAGGVGISF